MFVRDLSLVCREHRWIASLLKKDAEFLVALLRIGIQRREFQDPGRRRFRSVSSGSGLQLAEIVVLGMQRMSERGCSRSAVQKLSWVEGRLLCNLVQFALLLCS